MLDILFWIGAIVVGWFALMFVLGGLVLVAGAALQAADVVGALIVRMFPRPPSSPDNVGSEQTRD